MQRARRSALSMLVVGFALLGVIGVTPFSMPAMRRTAVVGWPVSTGAVVAEVVTGGASASDEYVEIANAGTATIDLQNVELLYVSSSGTSPTRKVAWTASRPLVPGQHLLVANAAGVFAATADATYASGLAATGGTIALRVIGGAVIDAVGWGDATNAFVEGAPAGAPSASSSVERRPGGNGDNRTDTNDNASDFVVQATPAAQNLASPPTPSPSSSPSPSPSSSSAPPTAAPSATPTPTASPAPTAAPSATDVPTPSTGPTPSPSATEPVSATTSPVATDSPPLPPTEPPVSPTPVPTDTPAPTEVPTATPVPTIAPDPWPTPEPVVTPDPTVPVSDPPASATPTPTPVASASPSGPVVSPIAAARSAPDGARVTVEGVLTTSLGAFDDARGAFVQDGSGGIGLYLDSPAAAPLPRGTRVRVTGISAERYSQRVLRVAPADVVDLGEDTVPAAEAVRTSEATETFEGRRIVVEGVVTAAPTDVADGTSVTIDDGSGPVRVVAAAPPAGLARGLLVRATGPLGQRDSTATGTTGYRVYATDPGDIAVLAAASPSPTASPSPSPVPSASPTVAPSSGPSPSPSPSPSTAPSPFGIAVITIAAARGLPVGTRVHVRGVVTAEVGRVGPSIASIQDATAGLAVHLPFGSAMPPRGAVLDVVGDLAAPYGQLEVRPDARTWRREGTADVPAPAVIAGVLDESLEGLLVSVQGSVVAAPATTAAGVVSLDIDLADGARVRVQADASSGIPASTFVRGLPYRLVGIVGQRASASGRLDGYRVWLRDPDDVTPLAGPSPSASASPSSSPTARPSATAQPSPVGSPTPGPSGPSAIPISAAILSGGPVVVEGVVVAGSGLLDADGRAIVIQDAGAAIMVRLPAGAADVRPGRRLRITGESGRSYGAPRILASSVADRGSAQQPAPVTLRALPTASVEWRLVRVSGVVRSVRRDGRTWKADVAAGGTVFLVEALAGAAIPTDRLRIGTTATIVGIARRPYPTAIDRRFAILPRSAADVTVTASGAGGADTSGAAASPRRTAAAVSRPAPASRPASGVASSPAPGDPGSVAASAAPLDVDLVDLPGSAGRIVRVGGLIAAVDERSIVIDDGTATAHVDLAGDALTVLPQLLPGVAVNLIGAAETGPGPRLAVTRAADVIPIANPAIPAGASAAAAPTALPAAPTDAGDPFGLSGTTGDTTEEPSSAAASVPLVLLLLAALSLAGLVALLLGRRPSVRLMAHPLPGARR